MKIFWSWQSDTHQPTGRYFVRDVLIGLASELNGVDGTVEAERPENDGAEAAEPDEGRIAIDYDTLDVAGHPPIADTILRKIQNAAVFVADLTPIAVTKAGKRVANPNVMIELGYALKALGHQRIVLILNQVDGAKLDTLPFDLKHWRAPVMYKLDRNAADDRIAEEAQQLKARLKSHIQASLKVAEREMKADRRLTHREPELELVFGDDMEMPIEVSQISRRVGVKSLDEIKAETPVLKLPMARSPIVPSTRRLADTFAAFAPPPKPEHWTREETEGYNAMVEGYYRKYEAYLREEDEFARLVLRSFQVQLILENNGTAPATNIDAVLTFPEGLRLHDFGKFPKGPEAPDPPPLRPMKLGHGWATPVAKGLDIPSLITPYHLRSTHIHPDRRQVRYDLKDLKHHERAMIDAFVVSFRNASDIGDFDVDYVITANEPLDPIRGTLHFAVENIDAAETHGGDAERGLAAAS